MLWMDKRLLINLVEFQPTDNLLFPEVISVLYLWQVLT